MARCPAHDDRNPSLSISRGRDGALVHCHAGCETDQITAALHLAPADLFDPKPAQNGSGIVASYNYTDEAGALLYQVMRMAGKQFRQRRRDSSGGWEWSIKGVRRVPYRLPAVLAAAQAGETIFVVEGEKDVESVERAGGVATCNSGGAGKWEDGFAAALAGARVIVVADKDDAGRAHARAVAKSLAAAGVAASTVEAATGKDATDHLNAGHTLDELLLVDLARQPAEPVPAHTTPRPARDPEPERERSTWWPQAWDGTQDELVPTLLTRDDGRALLYRGRTNLLAGEPESLKSWLGLLAAAEAVHAGGRALIIDAEDTIGACERRLLLLGLDRDLIRSNVDFVAPTEPIFAPRQKVTPGRIDLHELLTERAYSFAMIDATNAFLALESFDAKDGAEVNQWWQAVPATIARAGAAVAVIDHVAKNPDTRGRWPIGAQEKLALITGAAFMVGPVSALAPGRTGRCRLTVTKDRMGHVRADTHGNHAGEAVFDATTTGRISAHIAAPQQGDDWRPTALMAKVLDHLATNPGATGKELRALGKNIWVDQAVRALKSDGRITIETVGQTNRHYLATATESEIVGQLRDEFNAEI